MNRLKSGSQSNQRQDWSLPDHVGRTAALGRQIVREVLQGLPKGKEIGTAGDSFLLAFAKPLDAVRFALQSQAWLPRFSAESNVAVQEQIGIHLGEVVIAEHETEGKAKDFYGIQLATCFRVMPLAVWAISRPSSSTRRR